MGIPRRRWMLTGVALVCLAAAGLAGGVLLQDAPRGGAGAPDAGDGVIKVYKTPQCGCCTKWVDVLRDAGLDVEAEDISHAELNEKKIDAGLNRSLASCHTALVGDYVIEGHVPVAEIRRLLESEPDVRGLAVPGMPVGSPGMEIGDRQDPYDVLAFREDGSTEVFASYPQD